MELILEKAVNNVLVSFLALFIQLNIWFFIDFFCFIGPILDISKSLDYIMELLMMFCIKVKSRFRGIRNYGNQRREYND